MNVKPKSILLELDAGLLGMVDAEASSSSRTRLDTLRALILLGLGKTAQARGEEVPEAVTWQSQASWYKDPVISGVLHECDVYVTSEEIRENARIPEGMTKIEKGTRIPMPILTEEEHTALMEQFEALQREQSEIQIHSFNAQPIQIPEKEGTAIVGASGLARTLAKPVRTAHEALTSGDNQTPGEQRIEDLTKGTK